jgi:hypothetical protein
MNNIYKILLIFGFLILVVIFIYFCLTRKINDNFENIFINKSIEIFDNTKDTIIINNCRTDMLGAFIQGILNTIILNIDKNIIISLNNEQLNDFSAFENLDIDLLKDKYKNYKDKDKWSILGSENKNDHINYRKIMLNIIFKNYTDINNYKKNIEYKTTIDSNFDLDNLNINDRTNKLNNIKFKQFANNIRNNLKLYLPNYITNTNIVCIHFRAGDVTNMPERYTHSKNYDNLLKEINDKYKLDIYVFISEIPSKEIDNLDTFKKYNCKIITSNMCNTLQTLSVFTNCFIFIMAISSFSYVSSLLRDHENTITYYRDFWHKKCHNNIIDW